MWVTDARFSCVWLDDFDVRTHRLKPLLKKSFFAAERRRKRLRYKGESSICKPCGVGLRPAILFFQYRLKPVLRVAGGAEASIERTDAAVFALVQIELQFVLRSLEVR